MEIQPIVIGTAGHIDHGKSSLVQALSGIDPDRLKEEKARGLTIDLGFAPLQLADGRTVGIVDVPGHERFIKNMVAGASGIDLVVLVVAADDGVMPQTREHLSIMGLLGVERGLIALTKVDIVDPELVELAAEDVREAVHGTFLEDAPLFPLSSKTGDGLDAFRDALFAAAADSVPRSSEGVFRMPIQRVFSAKGFGTIVTGIPVAGRAKVGDVLEVLPLGKKGKVRGIQAYKESVDEGRAGHSMALNLADVAHDEVERGMVVASPGYYRAARMVGARLDVLAELDRPVTDRMRVRLHTGTAEVVGEIVLLDADQLEPGDSGLVQLRLDHEVVCAPGDPFIVRLASPLITLGGGRILEESRYRLKRFKDFVIDELAKQEQSLRSVRDLLDVGLSRAGVALVPIEDLARLVKRPTREVGVELEALADASLVVEPEPGKWIHRAALEEAVDRLRTTATAWFDANPRRARMDVRELRSATGLDGKLFDLVLEEAARRELLRQEAGGRIELVGHEPALDPAEAERLEELRGRFRDAAFQPPERAELPGDVGGLIDLLIDRGELVHVGGGLVFDAGALERARGEVVANCERHGELDIPELRDALGTSRKFLIPLLEHFDAVGVTARQGGRRVLRRR